MAIGFRAAGTLATRAAPGTGALSVPVPAGTAAGDVMLLVASTYSGNVAITTPSGWTLIATASGWATQYNSALFWKVAGASEPAASLNTAASSYLDAIIVGFTGVDNTTPIDAAGTWSAVSTAITATVPSITTVTANAWWLFFTADGSNQVSASSVPSGWTQRALATGNVLKYAISSVLVPTAGPTAATSFPRTGTNTPGQVSIGIALRQAVAGAPVADFTGTPLTGAWPLTVAFTDTSTNTPTSWDWDFGDGTSHATTQNPSHSYAAAGTYTVTLIATNASGSNTKVKTGYVTVSNPSGTMSKIRFGANLTVTDQGSGTILVDSPSGHLPTAGSTGQALTKTSGTDYATAWSTLTTLPTDVVVAAATRIIASFLAAGDTQPAWRVKGDGTHEWGPGGTTAPDTNLYRAAINTLKTDWQFHAAGRIIAGRGTANEVDISDTIPGIFFGSAGDTNLYRSNSGQLRTDGVFIVGNYQINGSGLYVGFNGNYTDAPHGLQFGSSTDTNLFRAGAGFLRTNGHMIVDGDTYATGHICTASTIAANTNGVQATRKLPIYDAGNALLGYVQLYTG